MKKTVCAVLSLLGAAVLTAAAQSAVPGNVVSLFEKKCVVCHKGKASAFAGLSWERAQIAAAIDKPSTEMPELKIIDTASPEASYLLKKVRRDKGIKGQPMPPATALAADELKALEDWVNSLKKYPVPASASDAPESEAADPPPAQAGKPASRGAFDTPAFWGTLLLNLPTTTTPDRRDVLVRISHRFNDRVEEGFDDFFGLDSYANILLSVGYGITNNLAVSVGRARVDRTFEFAADWLIAEQGKTRGLPFSVALHGGVDLVTAVSPDEAQIFGAVSLSRQFTRRLSVLVVPALVTNADYWALDPESTFALGLGARYMIFEGLSASIEWAPVLAGYGNVESGWGLGLEKKIGGHVFQFFVTNALGLAASQYLPGGDLRLGDFDFRIGFNIFRTF